jgi:hypothetical protein
LKINRHEGFEACPELAARPPDAFCDGAHLAVLPGQENDDPVCFTELVRTKDDAFRPVGSRGE